MTPGKSLQYFAAILGFRFAMVFVVKSQFVPDEYWQGPEVAHKLVFGYGHLTWEWLTGLRSYLYPLILAGPYWLLKYFELDSRMMIMVVPRLLQSFVTAVGDFCFLKYCALRYGSAFVSIVGCMYFSNWFISYCGARTLANSMEMSLNLIGLYLFETKQMYKFIFIMVLNFIMRPSAVVYWVPFIPKVLIEFYRRPYMFLTCSFIAFGVLHLNYLLDSSMYGKPTITWWNFIDFNYLQGKSALFGTHPFHWYFSSCLIVLAGGQYLLFCYAVVKGLSRYGLQYFILDIPIHREETVILFFVLVYSFVAHKELRFMLPVVPNMIITSAHVIDNWFREGTWEFLNRLVVPFLTVSTLFDVVALLYSSTYHLSGVGPATEFISTSIGERHLQHPLIWILMPCYSVPVYTHFHNPNATIEFFTCPPLELDLNMTNLQLRDFSDIDLDHWTRMKTSDQGHPDFVMFYSTILSQMQRMYPHYKVCFESFNTNFTEGNVGTFVNVMCRTDYT